MSQTTAPLELYDSLDGPTDTEERLERAHAAFLDYLDHCDDLVDWAAELTPRYLRVRDA